MRPLFFSLSLSLSAHRRSVLTCLYKNPSGNLFPCLASFSAATSHGSSLENDFQTSDLEGLKRPLLPMANTRWVDTWPWNYLCPSFSKYGRKISRVLNQTKLRNFPRSRFLLISTSFHSITNSFLSFLLFRSLVSASLKLFSNSRSSLLSEDPKSRASKMITSHHAWTSPCWYLWWDW